MESGIFVFRIEIINNWLAFSDESGVCAWSETAVGGALWYVAQLSVGFLYCAKFNIIWSGGNGANNNMDLRIFLVDVLKEQLVRCGNILWFKVYADRFLNPSFWR